MKPCLILIFISFFSYTSFAQKDGIKRPRAKDRLANTELNEDRIPSRSVRDIIYLPKAGDSYFSGGFSFLSGSASFQRNGIRTADYSLSSSQIEFFFRSGITEFLSFSIGLQNLDQGQEVQNVSGGTVTTKNTGFKAPDLGMTLLLFEQGPFRWMDLMIDFHYLPRFGSPSEATTSSGGNNIPPADQIRLGASILRKMNRYQLAGGLSFTPSTSGTSENATTGEHVTKSLPSLWLLEGQGQWLLMNRVYLTGDAAFSSYGATESEAPVAGKVDLSAHYILSLGAGAKYMLNPQNLFLSAGFKYHMVMNAETTSSGNQVQMQNYNVMQLNLGFGVAF